MSPFLCSRKRQHAVNASRLSVRATPDFVHDQRCFAITDPPNRTIDARMTLSHIEAFRKNQLMMISSINLVLIRNSSTTHRVLLVTAGAMFLRCSGFLVLCLPTTFLIGRQRIRFVQPLRRILLFQFFDPLIQSDNLCLQLHHQCSQLSYHQMLCSARN